MSKQGQKTMLICLLLGLLFWLAVFRAIGQSTSTASAKLKFGAKLIESVKAYILREAKKTTAYLGRFPFYAVGISITMNKKRHWLDYLVASGLYTLSSFATYEFIR